jgi:hypothetical protein
MLDSTKENEMSGFEGKLSDCCGAGIICHDICIDCHEHTTPMPEEEEENYPMPMEASE